MLQINSIRKNRGFNPKKSKICTAGGFQWNPPIHCKMEALRCIYLNARVFSPADTNRKAAETEILSSVTHPGRIVREVRHT
jgi:hypothetical protein